MIAPSKSYVLKNRNFYFGTFMLKNLNKELKSLITEFCLPVNNSLIDYPLKRYDKTFAIASDVINEKFTARKNRKRKS